MNSIEKDLVEGLEDFVATVRLPIRDQHGFSDLPESFWDVTYCRWKKLHKSHQWCRLKLLEYLPQTIRFTTENLDGWNRYLRERGRDL